MSASPAPIDLPLTVVRQVGLPAQVTGAGDLFGPGGERPRQQHNKKPGLSAGQ